MSIAVLGGGAFGTALAIVLSREHTVTLWARDTGSLAENRQTQRLPGFYLPDTVTVTGTLPDAETVLAAVPMQALSGVLHNLPQGPRRIVACCKGIDLATGESPSRVIANRQPQASAAVLTGPSFAADIARGLPTALTLACADEAGGKDLQHQLSATTLRLYRSTDVTGAELGGALKNVIAIACGACMGAGLGDSARAALMTRGFAEMTRLALHFGARRETLTGLSGLGDLALTCTSDMSRNYRFGAALGAGKAFDLSTTVEGVATAQAACAIAAKHQLDMPITRAVHAISTGALAVPEAIASLLTRPLREE